MLPFEGPLADDLRTDGIDVLIRPVAVLRRRRPALGGGIRELTRLARRAAIVHSNTSVVLSGALAARLAGRPHVWHVREIYSRFGALWPIYRRVLETASALPCVSAATAAQFRSAAVIHDALAFVPAPPPRPEARAALGLPVEAPVVAVLGRISDWKGQDILVRALASPELSERGALGLLAGDAWPGAEDRRDRVLALADSLGVRDRLLLCGFRDDVANVYGAADVVAVPSTAPDPLPGSAIEAAAAGCAVVAAAHGGLPEIIRDGETGRLVAPGDPRALAVAVGELLDDASERERLGRAAAADVVVRFAPERLIASLEALYDDLLATG